jgi:hypothetical protein
MNADFRSSLRLSSTGIPCSHSAATTSPKVQQKAMNLEFLFALLVGIAIGATAAGLITDYAYRGWLKDCQLWLKALIEKHLGEPFREAQKFYGAERAYPTLTEYCIWNTYQYLVAGLEYPEHFKARLNTTLYEMSDFVRWEFTLHRYRHLKDKAHNRLEEVRQKLPADNHMLLTAQHHMDQMSRSFSPTLLPHVTMLIEEMEKSLSATQAVSEPATTPSPPADS